MAARFSMHWAMPLEPGLPTHVALVDHADRVAGRCSGRDRRADVALDRDARRGDARSARICSVRDHAANRAPVAATGER